MSQGDTISHVDTILKGVSKREKEILDLENWLWWTDLVRITPPFLLLVPAIVVTNAVSPANLFVILTVFLGFVGSIVIWRIRLRKRKTQLELEVGVLQVKFAKEMYSAKCL